MELAGMVGVQTTGSIQGVKAVAVFFGGGGGRGAGEWQQTEDIKDSVCCM